MLRGSQIILGRKSGTNPQTGITLAVSGAIHRTRINTNAYVYPLDPINGSDYSGKTGCEILCISASEFNGMQSSSSAVAYLQPTVTISRIIYIAASTAQIHYTTTAPRAAAKPAYNNSTALPVAAIAEPLAPVIANLHAESVLPAPSTVSDSSEGRSFTTTLKSAGYGCAEGGVGLYAGIIARRGVMFMSKASGEILGALTLGTCLGGFAGGALTYLITGEDYPESTVNDFREGFSAP